MAQVMAMLLAVLRILSESEQVGDAQSGSIGEDVLPVEVDELGAA